MTVFRVLIYVFQRVYLEKHVKEKYIKNTKTFGALM